MTKICLFCHFAASRFIVDKIPISKDGTISWTWASALIIWLFHNHDWIDILKTNYWIRLVSIHIYDDDATAQKSVKMPTFLFHKVTLKNAYHDMDLQIIGLSEHKKQKRGETFLFAYECKLSTKCTYLCISFS